jgi:Tfp pilus assembly protein PilX
MTRHALGPQRGLTMLLVMLLMTAMLLGALAFARVTEVGALVGNNLATKDSSFHAAEVGRAEAFAQLQALAGLNSLDLDSGGWYWATRRPTDTATGLLTGAAFAAPKQVDGNVGRFTVHYVVDRLCEVNAVKDSSVECMVLLQPPNAQTGDAPDMRFPPAEYMKLGARQYRITVRVTDARNTQTWTQTLVTLN